MTPEAWSVSTLGQMVTADTGLQTGPFGSQLHASDYAADGIPVVMPKDLANGRIVTSTIARIPESLADNLSRHRILPGDILFGRRGDIGRCGLVTKNEQNWLCGTGCLRARLDTAQAYPSFLIHALTATPSVQWLTEHAVGQTMLNLNTGILAKLPILLPPLDEQRKIAAILSSVDDAIEATQSVIDQLQVVKKAMMAELLTRGLPGRHTRFKKTEIGEVPEEWKIASVGELAAFITSGSRGWGQFYAAEGALFIRSQNVRAGLLDLSDRAFVSPPEGTEGERTRVQTNDVLITITGNSVGNIAVVPPDLTEAYVSQHVGLIRLREPHLGSFLAMFLSPGSPGNAQVLAAQYGQSKPGLNLANLRGFRVPLPQAEELQQVETVVRSLQHRIDWEAAELSAARELKKALLSALLTGEIRVTPDEASP